MPNRIQLENRARVVGIDPAAAGYVNDSVLEQRVIYNETNATAVTGTLSSGTLTSDATADIDGETITIGPITYTMKTALTEAKATNTLTSNNTIASDGDTVTINQITYRFKTTIVKPYDVRVVTDADTTLTNLVSAITAAGTIGTDYATGTVAHPDVTAAAVSSHATVITAKSVGVFGNSFTLIPNAATLTATGVNFTGGVEPIANQVLIGSTADGSAQLTNLKAAIAGVTSKGTLFSNGTLPHPLVTGSTLTGTTLLVRGIANNSGLSIATTETGAHISWGAATMQTAVQTVKAATTYGTAGETGGALV